MNTELTPYLMIRTPMGFFRLTVLDETYSKKDQVYVTFHVASRATDPATANPGYTDLGVCLAYELVGAPNKDRVAKALIDTRQALVNHAGLMAQGMGLRYTHCTVQFFGNAFSAMTTVSVMIRPTAACGGEE